MLIFHLSGVLQSWETCQESWPETPSLFQMLTSYCWKVLLKRLGIFFIHLRIFLLLCCHSLYLSPLLCLASLETDLFNEGKTSPLEDLCFTSPPFIACVFLSLFPALTHLPCFSIHLSNSSWLRYLHFENKLKFKKHLLAFRDSSVIDLVHRFSHCLGLFSHGVYFWFLQSDSSHWVSSSFSEYCQLPTILTEPLMGETAAMERICYGNDFLQLVLLNRDKPPTAKAFSFWILSVFPASFWSPSFSKWFFSLTLA